MLKPAFGMITFLLGTLIVAIMLALMIPALKKTTDSTLGPSSVKTESVEEKSNEMIDEIQNMRNQAIEYNKEVKEEGY